MKLTLAPAGLGPFTICDDTVATVLGSSWPAGAGGASKEGAVVPKLKLTVQRQPLFRASYLFLAARYNLAKQWTVTVTRQFTTVEACYLFKDTHAETVPVSGELCETNTSDTGTITRYLPGAFLEACDCAAVYGLSCDFTYVFSAAGPWQSTP